MNLTIKNPTDGPVENDELEVYITYMINIRNQATDLTLYS